MESSQTYYRICTKLGSQGFFYLFLEALRFPSPSVPQPLHHNNPVLFFLRSSPMPFSSLVTPANIIQGSFSAGETSRDGSRFLLLEKSLPRGGEKKKKKSQNILAFTAFPGFLSLTSIKPLQP